METAELTSKELKHVERMAASMAEKSFSEPTMVERSKEWFERSMSHSKKEEKEKEGKNRPRELKLDEGDRSDEEKKFLESVAVKDESDSEKKPPAKSSAEKDAAKPADVKESGKPDAKGAEKPTSSESANSHVEPIAADLAERHWQGKLQGKEIETHISHVNGRIGVVLDFLSSHPQKAEMEKGFRSLCAGSPPVEKPGFLRDLATCLAEVSNPEKVFQHITMQAEDRNALRNVKTPKELRAAIQTIAKHYAASAPQASPKAPEPKPRAPKPPSEVGGRGAATEDAWKGMSFNDFATRQSQIHR